MRRATTFHTILFSTAWIFATLSSVGGGRAETGVAPPTLTQAVTRQAGGERCYVALFAYQGKIGNPIESSHTFATFLRATDAGSVVESHTISWCSTTDIIKLLRPAEPGINKSLAQTLDYAQAHELKILLCGAYEIRPEFLRRAATYMKQFDEGRIQYKVVDRLVRNRVKNCISAVADIYEDHGRVDTGSTRGAEATLLVVEHLKPLYLDERGLSAPQKRWLLTALKVDRYGIEDITPSNTNTSPMSRRSQPRDVARQPAKRTATPQLQAVAPMSDAAEPSQ